MNIDPAVSCIIYLYFPLVQNDEKKKKSEKNQKSFKKRGYIWKHTLYISKNIQTDKQKKKSEMTEKCSWIYLITLAALDLVKGLKL